MYVFLIQPEGAKCGSVTASPDKAIKILMEVNPGKIDFAQACSWASLLRGEIALAYQSEDVPFGPVLELSFDVGVGCSVFIVKVE